MDNNLLSYLNPILLNMINMRIKRDENIEEIIKHVNISLNVFKLGSFITSYKYSELYQFFCYKDYNTHIKINISMGNIYDPIALIRNALEINHLMEERSKNKKSISLIKFIQKLILKFFTLHALAYFNIAKRYNLEDVEITFTRDLIPPYIEITDMRDELQISKDLNPNFVSINNVVDVFTHIDPNTYYITGLYEEDILYNAYYIELCAIICPQLKNELLRYIASLKIKY